MSHVAHGIRCMNMLNDVAVASTGTAGAAVDKCNTDAEIVKALTGWWLAFVHLMHHLSLTVYCSCVRASASQVWYLLCRMDLFSPRHALSWSSKQAVVDSID